VDALTAPDREHGFQQLHSAAPFIWRIVSVPTALVIGGVAVVIAVLVADELASGPGTGITIVVSLAAIAGVAAAWWYPAHRYRHWHYRIGDEALELRRGVWFRSSASVPFHRIQQIDVEQGPLQRRHDVVTLHLRTASAVGSGTVPLIAATEADLLRERLLVAARAVAALDDGH